MVNGHGILHPRGFGLASQVGLQMDKPTIGLAKRLTAGNYTKRDKSSFKEETKSFQLIEREKETAGIYIKGYYVSIGHKISLSKAKQLVKATSLYRTPEPIRQAHILATKVFKDLLNKK
jgi:deoxyribonuclease V